MGQDLPVVGSKLLVPGLLVGKANILARVNDLIHLFFEFSDHVALILVGPVVVSRFKRLRELIIELINVVLQDITDHIRILFIFQFAFLYDVHF